MSRPAFFVNANADPDPDPDPVRGFDDQKLQKFTGEVLFPRKRTSSTSTRLQSRFFFSFYFLLTFALVFVILWTAAFALAVRSRNRPVASIVRVPGHEKYTLCLVRAPKKNKKRWCNGAPGKTVEKKLLMG
jgi:hypothetical protein